MQKRLREKAQRERAEAKRERRAAKSADGESGDDTPIEPARPQGEVLAQLAALHQRFADDQIDFDEFEASKAELLAQLDV